MSRRRKRRLSPRRLALYQSPYSLFLLWGFITIESLYSLEGHSSYRYTVFRRKYGRLEVEYSQLRSRGKGNYVFGGNGDDDDDNTIGEEDEEESQSEFPL